MNEDFRYMVIVYKLLGSKYVQEKFHSNSKVKGRGILCFPRYFDVTLYVFSQPSPSKRWMIWKSFQLIMAELTEYQFHILLTQIQN